MPQVVKDFAAALERVQAAERPGVKGDACLAHFLRSKETGDADVLVRPLHTCSCTISDVLLPSSSHRTFPIGSIPVVAWSARI